MVAEVRRLESAIGAAVPADDATQTTAGTLMSIPGEGRLTARLMAIDLPELGRLRGKQIASLAGVAPDPDESGKHRGRACIRGGRPRVRAKLYMAAFNAREDNPVIKAFHARLVARGQVWDPAHATWHPAGHSGPRLRSRATPTELNRVGGATGSVHRRAGSIVTIEQIVKTVFMTMCE